MQRSRSCRRERTDYAITKEDIAEIMERMRG